jgi:peptide/nickel transport system substrate-binding protein
MLRRRDLVAATAAMPLTTIPGMAPRAQSAGVLRVALGSMVAAMEPNARTSGPPSTIVYYPIFDTLVATDAQGNPTPALASAWRNVAPDTWELDLRSDVRFSNGEPFDAAAAKWTLERVLNPENRQVVRARITTIKSVAVAGPLTLRIVTTLPDPILPRRLASVFMLPPAYFQRVGEQEFANRPIGTGPVEVAAFQPSASVTLRAIESSWRGRPKVQQIMLRSIPDASTRVAALRAGEVHIAENIPPDLARQLGQGGTRVVANTIGQTNLIILNTRNPALADRRVRQALNHAVDKDAIVQQLLSGYGEATGQLVASNGVGHDPAIRPYAYDPARARQMLQAAGVRNLNVKIHTTQGLQLMDREVTEAVAGYLAAVGVTATIEVLETAAYVDAYHGGRMDPAFFIGWWYFPAMDGDFVFVWNESSRPQSRITNPEFDRLYAASTSEMDPDKRGDLLRRMGRLLHEEAAGIFLYHPQQTFGVRAEVSGFTPRPDRVINFDTIAVAG